MALDRTLPVSTTPGAVSGNSYMDAVQEEVTGLWDRSVIRLTGVSGTNAITATFVPALTAGLVDGMNVILRPVATNTGAVTLNGVTVRDAEGVALAAGALRSGAVYLLHYVTAITAWCIVSHVQAVTTTPGLNLLRSQTASASASIDFVHGASGVVLDDTYDSYLLDIANAKPATDDVEAQLRIGTGAGPTYQASGYSYGIQTNSSTGSSSRNSTSSGAIALTATGAGLAVGNASGEHFSGQILFSNPEAIDYPLFTITATYAGAGGQVQGAMGHGRYDTTGAITAVRFMFSSGNIASGRFSLYGLAKA